MRKHYGARINPEHVSLARERLGLPEGVETAVVLRCAVATVAGADLTAELDTTPGVGSASYRERKAAAA